MIMHIGCVHEDPATREALAERLGDATDGDVRTAASVELAAELHARRPFDAVVVQLDPAAAVVREVLRWHPVPAVVTVGPDGHDAVDLALVSGAHDHINPTAPADALHRVVDRSWRRHRAQRTRRAHNPPAPDLHDLRRRVSQLMSLAAAARDLVEIDDPPHTTVQSLLDQAGELGNETMELAGGPRSEDLRAQLDLEQLVREAWATRQPREIAPRIELDDLDIEVHGHAGMVRTALIVLFAHALRGASDDRMVLVDAVVRPTSVLLRIHDDGPPVDAEERRQRFGEGRSDAPAKLLTVEHVAARHGGTAWIADSDRIDGIVGVVELPRRVRQR